MANTLAELVGLGEGLTPAEMRRLATELALMCAMQAQRADTYSGEDAYHEAREAFETAAKAITTAIEAEGSEQPLSRSRQLAMFGVSVTEAAA